MLLLGVFNNSKYRLSALRFYHVPDLLTKKSEVMFAFSDTMQINTLTFHMLKFSNLYSLCLMLTYI